MASDLKAISLFFRYHTVDVLQGISLQVSAGQVAGLLGPNGSGKSTLLKILSGVLTPDAGHVEILGRPLTEFTRQGLSRKVAVVPQESQFGFPFSVLEIVLMGRHPHLGGITFESRNDINIARNALGRCGADHLAERCIHELSSGERQRVVFARALAQQPSILLLDEPASHLDIRHQVELYDIVRELASGENCTVLTVLHDLNLAAEYCDQIYLLSAGRIEAGGPATEILNYANLVRVFDTDIYIDTNSLTGKPLIGPMSKQTMDEYRKLKDR
ncbi:MAG TPA: ABC transporter ATP-binding protein [Gammaproteobacteria bacterium]|nr:ABC transporter ATP-binding protein [Gammaproteobacteria bacterium]